MITLRSPREINLMRQAGLLVWEAHQLIKPMVRPGAVTGEIDAAVERFFQEHGAEPLFKGVPGPVPFPTVTCMSVNEEVVHGIPSRRILREGDIVGIDTGCKVNGWCGDSGWTYAVGQIAPEVQRLLDVTLETLNLAIRLMGVKRRWSEIAREMEAYVLDQGFSVVETMVGHGIGRSLHEDPQVPNFVNEAFLLDGDFDLRPGLVIAVEPMVNLGRKDVKVHRDKWTQVTADGKPSAHFEHTLALTKDGPLRLTAGPGEEGLP
ncbi:MAG: type I methionyl aminopeptidase [Planctomycetes bacterium]|nr:type I methionyl aminopeptidase [Planctomycetota bacterium]